MANEEGSSLRNKMSDKQQGLYAKLFAEKIGPYFGHHDLDFSMKSLIAVDGCLEQAATVINRLPVKKRADKQRELIIAASAYIAKTLADNHQFQSVRDDGGQLVMLASEKQGWQVVAYVASMVQKKLEDPANESIIARFTIGRFLGEMFGGSNPSG